MALTADQSALLTSAVENLNQSVEINKQVLEIVKSVGNTGVVDIATHNNDPDAHENFDTVHASSGFEIGTSYDTERAYARFIRSVNKSQTYGTLGLDTYACQGATSPETGATGFSIRNVYFVQDWSKFINDQSFYISSISARLGYTGEDNEKTYTTTHLLQYGVQNGKNVIYIGIANTTGTGNSQFYFEDGCFRCNYTTSDLGVSSNPWKDCYLQNSPIVSSDRRLKQNFSDVPEAVFKAWANVNFQVYKFKEAVAKKGEAIARKHIGLVAQDIIEAFQAQGLDAFDYGIVCHDSWEDQYQQVEVSHTPAVLDKQGNVVTPENTVYENRKVKDAGDVYTVRYEEALALEAAYQRWKLAKIEQALTAKGITL